MKQHFAILLVFAALCLLFIGCGRKETDKQENRSQITVEASKPVSAEPALSKGGDAASDSDASPSSGTTAGPYQTQAQMTQPSNEEVTSSKKEFGENLSQDGIELPDMEW